MDSALPVHKSSKSGRKWLAAGETSRCSRCVRVKRGCDRRQPCSRCVEAGQGNECVYNGTIQQPRLRAMPATAYQRQSARTNLIRSETSQSDVQSLVVDEEDALPVTPGSMRVKRRQKQLQQSGLKARSANRKRSSIVDRHTEEDWYSTPPPREVVEPDPEPERSYEEMMRWKIFESFTDVVTHLPIEIYRSMTFVKELDKSYAAKTQELDMLCRELQASSDISTTLDLRRRICRLARESREDRAESVAEVFKLQTLVESHINLLSTDIGKFEMKTTMDTVVEEAKKPVNMIPKTKVKGQRRQSMAPETVDNFDIPIADDEPVYCYCHRVSFGKMIACESDHCEGGEWFHFECLGLSAAPKGKWWCRACTKAGLANKKFSRISVEELEPRGKVVRGESKAEKRARIREENRTRESARRAKLRTRRQMR